MYPTLAFVLDTKIALVFMTTKKGFFPSLMMAFGKERILTFPSPNLKFLFSPLPPPLQQLM